jgi:uncharacterized membrane protein YozB (DUF420 family)
MRHLLAFLAIVNSVALTLVVVGIFTILNRQHWFVWIFATAAVLNAILFLVLYRHVRHNPKLSKAQRNRWEIALFLASPITYPMYVWRFVLPISS